VAAGKKFGLLVRQFHSEIEANTASVSLMDVISRLHPLTLQGLNPQPGFRQQEFHFL
jgi:hypothetical protein